MRRVVFLFPSHRKWFAGKERTKSFCNFLIGTTNDLDPSGRVFFSVLLRCKYTPKKQRKVTVS